MTMIQNDSDILLDKSITEQEIFDLIDWILWESPALLIPSKEQVIKIKCLLLKRYFLYKEKLIENAMSNCDVFLDE